MSDTLKISGEITQILDIESGESKSGKAWRKQTFVINTGADFNPDIAFSLFGDDKITMLEKYPVGKHVEVLFNASSREFNGKFYHNLDCWKIQSNNVSTNEVGASDDDGGIPF